MALKDVISIYILVICIAIFPIMVSADDVLVWQGQYFIGTSFKTGTYEFNFTVYDNLTGGNICYSNMTNLTTGFFGEWITEQIGVNSLCNNVSKNYYLNIKINGIDQTPRRRLTVWNFLRKDVYENSTGVLETDIIKLRAGLKELNKSAWQSKLDYAEEFANTTLNEQKEMALTLIDSARNISLLENGETIELKTLRLRQAGERAKELLKYNVAIARARLLEAKKISLLNGYTLLDLVEIEEMAAIKEIALNITAQEQFIIIETVLNNSISEVTDAYTGVQFCLSDGTGCKNISFLNLSGENANQNINIGPFNLTTNYGFFNYLGMLISRISKLWVIDINASGNIETDQNISAKYFKGNGSFLTNLPGESGLPVYLTTNLTATNAQYITILTVPLTASKMNIVHAYLVQSSSTTGVAIQNRAIINESGPIGYCNFVTQTGGAEAIDHITVSTNSADTGETTMSLDTNVPFMNTVTCTVIADSNQKNLIIQFQSETAANVTTYAGSYYNNDVD
jgi:hypothetical protein